MLVNQLCADELKALVRHHKEETVFCLRWATDSPTAEGKRDAIKQAHVHIDRTERMEAALKYSERVESEHPEKAEAQGDHRVQPGTQCLGLRCPACGNLTGVRLGKDVSVVYCGLCRTAAYARQQAADEILGQMTAEVYGAECGNVQTTHEHVWTVNIDGQTEHCHICKLTQPMRQVGFVSPGTIAEGIIKDGGILAGGEKCVIPSVNMADSTCPRCACRLLIHDHKRAMADLHYCPTCKIAAWRPPPGFGAEEGVVLKPLTEECYDEFIGNPSPRVKKEEPRVITGPLCPACGDNKLHYYTILRQHKIPDATIAYCDVCKIAAIYPYGQMPVGERMTAHLYRMHISGDCPHPRSQRVRMPVDGVPGFYCKDCGSTCTDK